MNTEVSSIQSFVQNKGHDMADIYAMPMNI